MNNLLGVCSSFFMQPTAEKWRKAAVSGITETELGLSRDLPTDEILKKAQSMYCMLADGGIRVSSVHLSFGGDWDISIPDEPGCSCAIANTKALLDWAAARAIGIAVIHPSAEPIEDSARAARLLRSTASIRELGEYARDNGITLAVENLPRTCLGNCARDMLTLTDHGRSALMCFDVNHLLIETHRDFYEQVAPHVVTTHLSDYDRVNERHWMPGDGCIDWAELAELFGEHGYGGRYLFEISENASRKSDRGITPAELVERFLKITGKPLPMIL